MFPFAFNILEIEWFSFFEAFSQALFHSALRTAFLVRELRRKNLSHSH